MSKERYKPISLKKTALKSSVRILLALAATAAITYDHAVRPLDEKTCTFENSPLNSEVIDLVIEDLKNLDDANVAILFFPGGEGMTSLKDDPDVEEIVGKVSNLLAQRGYKPGFLHVSRPESSWEIVDQTQPSAASKSSAQRIALLAALKPELSFFMVARSNGAISAEETLCCLTNKDPDLAQRVAVLEMGQPFGNQKVPVLPEQTLKLIVKGDVLAQSDLLGLVRSNFPPKLSWNGHADKHIGPLGFDFQAVNHDDGYTWNAFGQEITNFVNYHFPEIEKEPNLSSLAP